MHYPVVSKGQGGKGERASSLCLETSGISGREKKNPRVETMHPSESDNVTSGAIERNVASSSCIRNNDTFSSHMENTNAFSSPVGCIDASSCRTGSSKPLVEECCVLKPH